jgi:hypothetical protein
MPRRSAEEKAAAFYRVRTRAVEPPRGMSAAARRAWREIIASKPVDWFDPGSLQLLRLHCEAIAGANKLAADLRKLPAGSREFTRGCAAWKAMYASAMSTARALRLTTQQAVESRSAKITEPSTIANIEDRLLGGREAA